MFWTYGRYACDKEWLRFFAPLRARPSWFGSKGQQEPRRLRLPSYVSVMLQLDYVSDIIQLDYVSDIIQLDYVSDITLQLDYVSDIMWQLDCQWHHVTTRLCQWHHVKTMAMASCSTYVSAITLNYVSDMLKTWSVTMILCDHPQLCFNVNDR